ncbi:MAG: restriction endonuclease subunit S [Gammaproteobacteria bacterium]|nr:restriction endonuclease subunit S [Gammaproteobacteria bacterium]
MTFGESAQNLPRLRFPEFWDTEEWEEGRCRDIATVHSGYGFPDRFQGVKQGQYPFYKVSDISRVAERGCTYIREANNHIDIATLNKIRAKTVPSGTVIFAKIGEAIRSNRRAIMTIPAVIDNNTAGLKSKKNLSSDKFIFYLWSNVSLMDYAGGVVPAVSKSALENVRLCYPHDLEEQQKIADCLSSVDELIEAQEQKIHLLRDYKKGLMQQLFPQEGEAVPRLRFPEFENAGEWEYDQIGNIASITKGKGLSKTDLAKEGETPCIRYAELYTLYGAVIHEIVSSTNVPEESLVLSQAHDIIIPASGETKQDIARAACICPKRVALGGDINILRSNLHGPFFSYALNGPLRHTVARFAQGDTVAHLYSKQISQVNLAYPAWSEQQKIADCLSSVDDLIETQGQKLDALRDHKKGLMQQLFPVH